MAQLESSGAGASTHVARTGSRVASRHTVESQAGGATPLPESSTLEVFVPTVAVIVAAAGPGEAGRKSTSTSTASPGWSSSCGVTSNGLVVDKRTVIGARPVFCIETRSRPAASSQVSLN